MNSWVPFDVHIEYTRAGGKRLTKERAKEVIFSKDKERKIEKVYVCGPPSQNIMFYEMKEQLVNDGIKDVEVL